MTLLVCWSVLRATLVAATAVMLAGMLYPRLNALPRRWRTIAWCLSLHPFLFPPLITVYAYSHTSLSLIRYPVLNECLYLALLIARAVPVGLLGFLVASRPALSEAGLQVARMVPSQSVLFGLSMAFQRSARCLAPFFMVWWITFQEFEIASFLVRPSWTVTLFDAHTGGLLLSESLRAVAPAACVLLTVWMTGLICLWLIPARIDRHATMEAGRQRFRAPGTTVCVTLIITGIFYTAIPWLIVLQKSLPGIPETLELGHFLREVGTGCTIAFASSCLAYGVARVLASRMIVRSRTWAVLTGAVLCLPGISGSLVLSLAVLAAVLTEHGYFLLDTAIPWIATQALLLLPHALLLTLITVQKTRSSGDWTAHLLCQSDEPNVADRGRRLIWKMRGRPHALALSVLSYLAYLELTCATILAPVYMVPAPVRLYNLMHYGHSAVLSAMLLIAFLLPVALAIILIWFSGFAYRYVARWLRVAISVSSMHKQ